jgi:hypothetical protein
MIPSEMLATGRDLVNTAVKLINGHMNYLKRAAKKSAVREDVAEHLTAYLNNTDDYPITNN